MTARPEVHDRADLEERAGNQAAGRALEHSREQASMKLLEQKSFDIADIPEDVFKTGLERIQRRQARLQQIIGTVMIKGAHYGNPNNAFKKDILYKAGAEELRETFRLKAKTLAEDAQVTAEFVSVTVTVGLFDLTGRQVAEETANCNSLEPRFRKFDKSGPTYQDARETIDNCTAMALKRARSRATMAATGASAFFANEDDMEAGLEARVKGDEPERWSDEARKKFMDDARAAGVKSRRDLEALITKALGGERPVLVTDIPKLYEVLTTRKQEKAEGKPAEEKPEEPKVEAPATEPPTPAPATEQDLADDAKLADA